MNGKRPAEDSVTVLKRTRIKLASPSPERTSESDTESIHSCQGYKTELANDTSDTSSSSLSNFNHAEYEIVDSDEQKLKYYFSDDSMEQDDFCDDDYSPVSNDSLDNALLGDTSEENSTSPTSNSDVDPGLPRNDYLDFEKCLLCQTDKKNISYPYCSSCFTWKKNLFPSRPKKRQKRTKKAESQSNVINKNNFTLNLEHNKNEKDCLEIKVKEDSSSQGLFEDSGVGSSEAQLSEDTVDAPSTSSLTSISTSGSSSLKSSEACRVCFLKPENGLFVHLNSAHRYGCYSCAKEIWYHNGGCPICRRKVFKVTKLYI